MTAAYRLKGLGWFASCVVVTLGFYLVSLQVASERKKLEAVDARIGAAQRDIRALETEFDTRANLAQLEKWNGDTLALAAPGAGQFVRDEGQLAAIDVNAAAPVPGPTQAVAMVVPSAPPVYMPATPIPAAVVAAVPRVARVDITAPRAPVQPAPTPAPRATPAAETRVAATKKTKPVAVAMLDRKLLSDHTLDAILSGARAEASRRR